MSSPNPRTPDRSDPDYGVRPTPPNFSIKDFKSGMKDVRSGLQKVVGHKRRERHTKAKNMAKKMKGRDFKTHRDEYDERLDEHNPFYK